MFGIVVNYAAIYFIKSGAWVGEQDISVFGCHCHWTALVSGSQ